MVRIEGIAPYILPAPSAIVYTLYEDWPILYRSLMVTLTTTFEALIAAMVGGVSSRFPFTSGDRWSARSFRSPSSCR